MAYLNFSLSGKKITDDNYFFLDGEGTQYRGMFDNAVYNIADGMHKITFVSPNGIVPTIEINASASEMAVVKPTIDDNGNITAIECGVGKVPAELLGTIKAGAKELGEIDTNGQPVYGMSKGSIGGRIRLYAIRLGITIVVLLILALIGSLMK